MAIKLFYLSPNTDEQVLNLNFIFPNCSFNYHLNYPKFEIIKMLFPASQIDRSGHFAHYLSSLRKFLSYKILILKVITQSV